MSNAVRMLTVDRSAEALTSYQLRDSKGHRNVWCIMHARWMDRVYDQFPRSSRLGSGPVVRREEKYNSASCYVLFILVPVRFPQPTARWVFVSCHCVRDHSRSEVDMETELAILFDDVRILQMSRMFQCQYGISYRVRTQWVLNNLLQWQQQQLCYMIMASILMIFNKQYCVWFNL